MVANQTFSATETNHFIPSRYPLLEVDLQEIATQLAAEPECKTNMLVSFVKDHCMDSRNALDHPQLASRISTGGLPLHIIETLFKAGKNSPPFKKELEQHIRGYIGTIQPGTHY